ncbi:MAG: hypothetical protein MZV49_24570 [Rhodopseudomonas palustris]|nr:hypothetical protein [Rhodopseudomonas palustris]
MRLCGNFVPDVDQITACMIRGKAQLSQRCAVYFQPAPRAAAPTGHRAKPSRRISRRPNRKPSHKPSRAPPDRPAPRDRKARHILRHQWRSCPRSRAFVEG